MKSDVHSPRSMFARCSAILALVTLASQYYFIQQGLAQQDASTSASASATQPFASAQTARGFVFEDRNQNSQRDTGEPGMAGVRVSNGVQIVLTQADGSYELPIDDDTILFVIKPRNYMTPVNEHQLPQFYYIHKPAGSPPHFMHAGVAPTGPLPPSVDFALYPRPEPNKFRALLFGDTQSRDVIEVEYMAHDVIEQVIGKNAHDASFGVTLGDIVFDDLSVFEPHNAMIALIGIPWYNVLGNHDQNYDAADDPQSDETFERFYGPNYYSFDHGPVHFLVLDDVRWIASKGTERAHYVGGFGSDQMAFIRNDLAGIPEDQMVVLMMHIPLVNVEDRQELFRLIEKRPASLSISAHQHYMEHVFLGDEHGWHGPEKHHHIINVTVCGSWWTGRKDERGIPHATMSDGGPNGYSILEFDGASYSLEFRAAGRPADYQMNIYVPETVAMDKVAETKILVNVFAGSDQTICELRAGRGSSWVPMQQTRQVDPAFAEEIARDRLIVDRHWRDLPKPHPTPHIWQAKLGVQLALGAHLIEVRATGPDGKTHVSHRAVRVVPEKPEQVPPEVVR